MKKKRNKARTVLSSESDEAKLAAIRAVHPFLSDHRAAQLAYRNGLRRMWASRHHLRGPGRRKLSKGGEGEVRAGKSLLRNFETSSEFTNTPRPAGRHPASP